MDIDITQSKHSNLAMQYFYDGYNCSQAVLLAFSEETGLDNNMALKLSSSFGGGMGRLREVCGAVSGMFMVAGLLYGYDDANASVEKSEHYSRIQKLAAEFELYNHSIVCRTLLGLDSAKDAPTPSERTSEYYKKRPCPELVGMAAAIMEKYIAEYEI